MLKALGETGDDQTVFLERVGDHHAQPAGVGSDRDAAAGGEATTKPEVVDNHGS